MDRLIKTLAFLSTIVSLSAPAATPDINNFRLDYSTAGYDSRGTKVVLVRTDTAISIADVSIAASQWNLKTAGGAVVASGALSYSGVTYGIQYWVADFSSYQTDGVYSMDVILKQDAATSIGTKQTLNFNVQKNNFSKTMLIPLSLNNADARKAADGDGFYDATATYFREAYSHGIFLYGLLQMYKYKYDSLSSVDQARLKTDIDIAFDHLIARWSPDDTSLFAHPEVPTRGGMNDIEPFYGMALFIDMFKTEDPTRANDANFSKLVTAFNILKTAAPGWQDAGYQQYKDYLIPAAVHMYRYSGDVSWKNEATSRLNTFMSTFNLRTFYRGSARSIPLLDGLRLCAEQFPADPNYAAWITQARTIKDTYFKSSQVGSGNVFHIINTSSSVNPAANWDAGQVTGDMWGSLMIGYATAPYADDALVLAKLTGDSSLEKIAAGEIYWDMGLNPGIPQASVVSPASTADKESAAFILNAPFRHVTGVTYRDFTMRNTTYMTLVNGFNTNGGANEFDYVGTTSYNGEDFIKHDAGLIQGALMYEDYLSGKNGPAAVGNGIPLREDQGKNEMRFDVRWIPSNAQAMLQYTLPTGALKMSLLMAVYNVSGHCVSTLINGAAIRSVNTVVWNTAGNPSGVYFVRLQSGNAVAVRELCLSK
jgi:Cellulase N-terminal ig-like domain